MSTPVRRPTMHHVAERAGVSLKTVSRVINGEGSVTPETAGRVERAIEELNFQRNDLARSLRHGASSTTLGLLIEDVSNPFYATIAQAVEQVARARGYLLITGSCEEDPELERQLVQSLLRRRVDALLLVPAAHDQSYLSQQLGPRTPVVFLDRPPQGMEADTVLLDNEGGAYAATKHLLAHGHRRVAFIGDAPELFTANRRLAGYGRALADAGLSVDPALVPMDSKDDPEAAVNALLALPADRRPTALFTGNNRLTVGALRALQGREHEIALVGFDDFELAELLAMPTTVVRHDIHSMGTHAAQLAFARLSGRSTPPERVIVPTELVARGSGEIAPPAG